MNASAMAVVLLLVLKFANPKFPKEVEGFAVSIGDSTKLECLLLLREFPFETLAWYGWWCQ